MSEEDLEVRPESLEDRENTNSSDLRIGQYDFFAPKAENRYDAAREGEQARLEEIRAQPFTGRFEGSAGTESGTEHVKALPILEASPEYTQGLYDEAGAQNEGMALIVLIIAAISIGTFFATRTHHKNKKRKEAGAGAHSAGS